MEESQYVLLYVSTLSADTPVTEVANITRHARVRNAERGITGVLAFDGMTFVQLLEGHEPELRALLEHLRRDPRHVDFELLRFRPEAGPRRLSVWSMGYHLTDSEDDALERFRGLNDDAALHAFDQMAAGLDVGAGAAPS